MTRPAFALNVLLASLLLSGTASAAGYQFKVNIHGLPQAVWPSCATPWDTNLAHNEKVFAYSAESVPAGESCETVKQERTCNKGTLSGTNTFAACTPASSCTTPKQVVTMIEPGYYQTVVVPTGCASVTIKAWGSGGSAMPLSYTGYGGGGGYAERTISVSPGSALYAWPGHGGWLQTGGGGAGYPGGGGTYSGESNTGGAGGGWAGVSTSTNPFLPGAFVLVAGAGGGAGGTPYLTAAVNGGAGGGGAGQGGVLLRESGGYFLYASGGGGGTPTVGGAGGAFASSGTALTGGFTSPNRSGVGGGIGGGGGGGGWYGGGGGGATSTDTTHYPNNLGGWGGGGGGGGSSYAPDGVTLAGDGRFVANSVDSDYVPNTGNGGGTAGASGQNGAVVFIWKE